MMPLRTSAFLWLAAGAVLVAGYAAVVRPAERYVAATLTSVRVLDARERALEERLHRQRALRDAAQRVQRELAASVGIAGGGEARLVRTVAAVAARSRVGIVSIAPSDLVATDATQRLLSYRNIAVGVRGTFNDVLAVLPALSDRDPLLDVRDVRIAARSGSARAPLLDVVVDARLYSVQRAAFREVQ